MTTVLIASYLEPEYVAEIEAAFPQVRVIYRPDLLGQPRYVADHTSMPNRTPEQEQEWRSLLAQADILFDFDYSHREDLPDLAPNLKWIQATSAGIGKFVERMKYAERTNWLFTTASGVHARPLAEFVIFAMLFFEKNFEYLQREKEARHWQRYTTGELPGKTVSIIGLGKIGREVARLAKCFDMRVIGSRRDPSQTVEGIDALYAPGDLRPLLEHTDYLVLATPHTHETERMIGEEELALLPQNAVLINIARGAVVDQAALTRALQNGRLRGAALDVFEVEPLPPDDPLWSLPNVIISPHSASTAASENRKLTDLFIENLRRYLAGEPLLNLLDVERQY
ncbi:MAG: D-2-hydroxyacid dehydrogenase [Chloroflexota bacterium]|nr:MAG: D-2-hydroxyacid dehydrogenase [Chloroflexota bacterium]